MVEACNSLVGPVFTQCREDVAQGVRPEKSYMTGNIPQLMLMFFKAHITHGTSVQLQEKSDPESGESPTSTGKKLQLNRPQTFSHLVMVPSMSEITILSSQLQRKIVPWQRQVPWYWVVTLNTTSLGPSFSCRLACKSIHRQCTQRQAQTQTQNERHGGVFCDLFLQHYIPNIWNT